MTHPADKYPVRNFINIVLESQEVLAGVPRDIVDQYSNGDCMWLAVALNRRYGFPISAQMHRDTQHGDYVAHAYVTMPDGRELDILGPQEQVDIFAHDVQEWDVDDLLATMELSDGRREAKIAEADRIIDLYVAPKLAKNKTHLYSRKRDA